jgi:hypothetical protein
MSIRFDTSEFLWPSNCAPSSRDLNLVLAPAKDGKAVRFVVRLDGAPPRGKLRR